MTRANTRKGRKKQKGGVEKQDCDFERLMFGKVSSETRRLGEGDGIGCDINGHSAGIISAQPTNPSVGSAGVNAQNNPKTQPWVAALKIASQDPKIKPQAAVERIKAATSLFME